MARVIFEFFPHRTGPTSRKFRQGKIRTPFMLEAVSLYYKNRHRGYKIVRAYSKRSFISYFYSVLYIK